MVNMQRKKTIRRIVTCIVCIAVVFLILFFVWKDFRLYVAIRYKLLTTIDPLCEYVNDIYIGDDHIYISKGIRDIKIIDYPDQYSVAIKASLELNDYIYSLQQSDFWCDSPRSVYIESDEFRGGLSSVEVGTGYGTDHLSYKDGHIGMDDYNLQGKWVTIRYFSDDFNENTKSDISAYENYKIFIE